MAEFGLFCAGIGVGVVATLSTATVIVLGVVNWALAYTAVARWREVTLEQEQRRLVRRRAAEYSEASGRG